MRAGEDEAIADLIGALDHRIAGIDDPSLRAAVFDAIEYRISPEIDDDVLAESDTEPFAGDRPALS